LERLQRLENKWPEDIKVSVFHEEETGNLFKKWEKDAIEKVIPFTCITGAWPTWSCPI
jgi:hypothetical protein